MKNYRAFENQIPVWINLVTDGDPERYLMANDRKAMIDLKKVYETSRIIPENNVIFHLSLALMLQLIKNSYFEKAIASHCDEILALKSRLNKLEKTKGKRCSCSSTAK